MIFLLFSCSMVSQQLGNPLDPADGTEQVFEVAAGSHARSLGPALEDAGLVGSADAFSLYVRMTKEGGCLKAGRFRLRPDMSAGEILATLCGAPIPDDIPFTIVEGWRVREIDAALHKEGLINEGAYAKLAGTPSTFSVTYKLPEDTLEGYLFPETYGISPERFDSQAFIQRQLDMLSDRFITKHTQTISERGLHSLVIMASMLEREEPIPDNRPLVAGILWKRLDNDWNLGVDATSRYTLQEWNDRRAFLARLRDPNDPYNTRLRAGLPPTPIGNPSLSSLEAALNPVDSDYWYYLHDKTGKLHPSPNARTHEKLRRTYNIY